MGAASKAGARGVVCGGEGKMDLFCQEVGKHRGDEGLVPPRGSTGSWDALDVRCWTTMGTVAGGPACMQPSGTPSHGNDAITAIHISGAPGRAINPNPHMASGGCTGERAETQ